MTAKFPALTAQSTDCGTGWHDPPHWTTRPGQQVRVWRVTLGYKGRTQTVTFRTGPAHGKTPPSADDALGCLLDDAHAYDDADGFYDWCHHYGMEPDDRAAEMAYTAVRKQTERLVRLVGDDYEQLMYGGER